MKRKHTRKPTFIPEDRRHLRFSTRVPRKLSDDKVRWARDQYANGAKCAWIATMLDVHDATAYKVVKRITWRHVG